MKFGKIILVEIVVIVVILLVVLVAIEGVPTLGSTGQNSSIGMYQEKSFSQGKITLTSGQTQNTQFNYTSYDPAILQINLNFQTIQSAGNLTLYCNGRAFTSIIPTSQNPQITLTAISVSGNDIVQTTTKTNIQIGSIFLYGNEISFTSTPINGFEGTFNYQIYIRGSR